MAVSAILVSLYQSFALTAAILGHQSGREFEFWVWIPCLLALALGSLWPVCLAFSKRRGPLESVNDLPGCVRCTAALVCLTLVVTLLTIGLWYLVLNPPETPPLERPLGVLLGMLPKLDPALVVGVLGAQAGTCAAGH